MSNYPFGCLVGDEYALEMMRTLWLEGKHRKRSVVEVFYRKAPFKGSYTIAVGMNQIAKYLNEFRFSPDDLAYIGTLGFEPEFVDHLKDFVFTGGMWAVEEGTLLFPNEPGVQLIGAIEELLFFEGRILNIFNPQTLIATKASRVVQAAAGDPVLDMGLRRAHGYDASVMHSRAAYIAGVTGTSNLEAGKLFGVPVKGTHAHALVMALGEYEGFLAWAKGQLKLGRAPVFLVDTYDVVRSGIPNAIKVCRELGCQLGGIRLDSGDLAYLAKEGRRLLDDAGFPDAMIVASGDLDEYLIRDLKGSEQNAPINLWGVGTNMIVSADQPALGGVYKIVAMEDEDCKWVPSIKLSENPEKITNPGLHQVVRFRDRETGKFLADMITLARDEPLPDVNKSFTVFDPLHPWKKKKLTDFTVELLLRPYLAGGWSDDPLDFGPEATRTARERCAEQMQGLWPEYRRLTNPEIYPVDLSEQLWGLKQRLILEGRHEEE